MSLTEFEVLQGSLTLTVVIIFIITGSKILFKYFSLKRKELLTIRFTWIFLSGAWWGSTLSFLSLIIFNSPIEPFLFLFISNIFIPLALICWIYSMAHIFYPKLEKRILLIYLAICVPYEIFLIIFLLTDPSIIGTVTGPVDSKSNLYSLVFIVFAIGTSIVTGSLFANKSMKLDDPEVRWKGKFLLIAFITFSIGAILDAAIPQTPITLIITRLILISSAAEYYLGFFLPDWVVDLLIKDRQ